MTEFTVLDLGGKITEALDLEGMLRATIQDFLVKKHRDSRIRAFVHKLGETLIEQGFAGGADEVIDRKLRAYLSDEDKSDAFFEVYRRVFFSASREIGPRVMAMLAARLVVQERFANDDEESMFLAAEEMNDRQLRRLAQLVNEAQASEALEQIEKYGGLALYEHGIGHVPYFFTRLVNYGLVATYSSQRLGVSQLVAILVNERTRAFVELIDRATGPAKWAAI